jgi:2-hydroxychromene-2-carboxylate isomerase
VPAVAAFYFDLASPLAYLAAERVLHELPCPAEWRPVLAAGLARGAAPASTGSGQHEDRQRAEVERRARELGLQSLRWPEPFPFDSSLAMRVAAYAASIGRAVPFAQAAFRQAFAGGHSLENPDFVLIAAAACEMHPAAVLRGAELRSTHERLAASTAAAADAGVTCVPAIVIAEHVFHGEGMLARGALHMRERPAGEQPAALAIEHSGPRAR